MSINLSAGGIIQRWYWSLTFFVQCTEGKKAESVLLFLNHSHKSKQENQHQAYSFSGCVLLN